MSGQSFAAGGGTGFADHKDLGMGGWVAEFAGPVAGTGHDPALWINQNGAHRHLAAGGGGAGFVKGCVHMACKTHAGVLPRTRRFRKARLCAKPCAMTEDTHKGDRIAKVIARAGLASRREAERMIEAGRVTVNGKKIDRAALNVTDKDRIAVDGRDLRAPEPQRLWLYHKPTGLVTTNKDEQGRPTIFDELPEDLPRVMSVGRLDINSEGLLLLTNDGGLKRKLELPSTGWLRRYRVRVNGRPTDDTFAPLRQGLVIDGEKFQPMIVTLDRQQGANAWVTVGIREGRNREVRRAMEAVGLSVNRLIRVSYGPFQLGTLKPGAVEEIRPRILRDQLGETSEEAQKKPGKPAPKRTRRRT